MKAPGILHAKLGRARAPIINAILSAVMACLMFAAQPVSAHETILRCFPVGPIYDYRWQVLQLALAHSASPGETFTLEPYSEDVTQNRAVLLLQSKAIDVIALGPNPERETQMLPIRIDILRGIIGYRVLLIRAGDQARIAHMDDQAMRQQLTFGLNEQWADFPVLHANGFRTETSNSYESLFNMLMEGRFNAFSRGLNEASREFDARRQRYPQLAIEQTKALYYPYPIYFWVNKDNTALAQRITRGLQLSLADGSFRRLFETTYAAEIAMLKNQRRHVIRLSNPVLPAGDPEPDTRWWWRPSAHAN